GGRLGVEVDGSQRFIRREWSPDTRVARVFGGSIQPSLVSGFALAGNRVEDPQFLSGADVEGHDVALHIFLVRVHAALSERGTDHDDIIGNNRCGTVSDLADQIACYRYIQLCEEIDD